MNSAFLAAVVSSFRADDGGGVVVPDGYTDGFITLPGSVPDPILWFSPRFVETNASGGVTKLLNKGTLGSAHDATPATSNLATVEAQPFWENQQVLRIPDTDRGGYVFPDTPANTGIAMVTFKDGATAFADYYGIFSGAPWGSGSSTELQLLGQAASGRLYTEGATLAFRNGVLFGTSATALPLTKDTIAAVLRDTTAPRVGCLFQDNFDTRRNWRGQAGDLLFFAEPLTDAQILLVHDALTAWYGEGSGRDPIASLPTSLRNVGADTDGIALWEVTGGMASVTSASGVNPYGGSRFFAPGAAAQASMQQAFRPETSEIAGIDAGGSEVKITWMDSALEGDTVRVEVDFYDGANAVIQTGAASPDTSHTGWTPNTFLAPVPAGTRKVLVRFVFTRVSGTQLTAFVDFIGDSIQPVGGVSEISLPVGFPQPVVWYSAAAVQTDANGNVTRILNKGTLGETQDLTPGTSNLVKVVDSGAANGNRPIFNIPLGTTQGYAAVTAFQARSVMGLGTYNDGVDVTFDSYDGYISAGGGSVELVGNQGSAQWYSGQPSNFFMDGLAKGSGATVLPLKRRTIGGKGASSTTCYGLWSDGGSGSRGWNGKSGDVMFFDVQLTDAQMLALHQAFAEFYNL
ncbi:hypothetical protein ACM25O_13165 [Sulfitobacter pontiacus]